MTVYRMILEGTPPGPNNSRHWTQKMRDTKFWREYSASVAIAEELPTMPRIRVNATFKRRNFTLADQDNDIARLKPILDGLVDAGVIANDTRAFVVIGSVESKLSAKPYTVLSIEPIAPVCSRCASTQNDVREFALGLSFCFVCYALMVSNYIQSPAGEELRVWLRNWAIDKGLIPLEQADEKEQ